MISGWILVVWLFNETFELKNIGQSLHWWAFSGIIPWTLALCLLSMKELHISWPHSLHFTLSCTSCTWVFNWDLVPRVCEKMSCEESNFFFYICRYPPLILMFYGGILPEDRDFSKILNILTWLIKAMINRGTNGYLRKKSNSISQSQFLNHRPPSGSLNDLRIYLFIFNLENVVEILAGT